MPFDVSGVSIKGVQLLGGGSLSSTFRFAILIPTLPQHWLRRAGYFYVCPYLPGASLGNAVIDRDLINQPGYATTLNSSTLAPYAGIAVYVDWNIPGLNWRLTTY